MSRLTSWNCRSFSQDPRLVEPPLPCGDPGPSSADPQNAHMTADFAARRGIVDRESGAASALAARKEMTSRAAAQLGAAPALDDTDLTMFGLLTRLQAFNEGATREIAADNPFASASCIRSLAEVVALICYLIEKPQELRRVSIHASDQDRFNIGKLLMAAHREASGFKAVYEQLSNFAHPSYAGSTVSMKLMDDNHFTWTSAPSFKYDSEACTMYLWILELTEAGGTLWCRLYDRTRGSKES